VTWAPAARCCVFLAATLLCPRRHLRLAGVRGLRVSFCFSELSSTFGFVAPQCRIFALLLYHAPTQGAAPRCCTLALLLVTFVSSSVWCSRDTLPVVSVLCALRHAAFRRMVVFVLFLQTQLVSIGVTLRVFCLSPVLSLLLFLVSCGPAWLRILPPQLCGASFPPALFVAARSSGPPFFNSVSLAASPLLVLTRVCAFVDHSCRSGF